MQIKELKQKLEKENEWTAKYLNTLVRKKDEIVKNRKLPTLPVIWELMS